MKELLVFGLIATISSVRSQNSEIKAFLKDIKVIPNCYPARTVDILNVTYENGVLVNPGKELTPTQVKNNPFVLWKSNKLDFYTLMMIYTDTPPISPQTTHRHFQHWLVVNIPGTDIGQSEVLSEYLSSGPPKGAGFYIYVFLLYKQPSKLEFDEHLIDKFTVEGRSNFSALEFAGKYGLGHPKAANFFKAQYDEYVPVVHAQIGLSRDVINVIDG